MAQSARQCFAKQWCQRRTDRQRKAAEIAKERQSKPRNRVARPCPKTPMHEGPDIRFTQIVRPQRRADALNNSRVVFEMRHRLCDSPSQHSNTNSCTKHHREPRKVAEFWRFTILTKVQTPCCRPNRQSKTNDYEKGNDPDIPSRKIVENCSVPSAQNSSGLNRPENAPHNQHADYDF